MDGVQGIAWLMLLIQAWRSFATLASPMSKTWRCLGLVADTTPSFRDGAGIDLSKVPDCVEPVVAYRTWCWEKQGITSFNGDCWKPGVAFEATCPKNEAHLAPAEGCTCGMYAGIDMQYLIDIGYIGRFLKGIHGEVYLWGRLYKYSHGWRAQYAYPKSFVIPPDMLPSSSRDIETLVAYNVDIYLQKDKGAHVDGEKIPLWTKERGWSERDSGSCTKLSPRERYEGPMKIDWRFSGSSYNCQIAKVRGKSDHLYRFFWAGAIRSGGWRGFVSGWDVWEADAAGCLIEYVGKKLRWDEVDQAVQDYLAKSS